MSENQVSDINKDGVPLAQDIKFIACMNNHVHMILLDTEGNEIAEIMIEDQEEANTFANHFKQCCDDAFKDVAPLLKN